MLPQFSEKHDQPSLITPAKMLEHRKAHGRLPSTPPPKTVIICFSGRNTEKMLEAYPHDQCDGCFPRLHYFKDHPTVAIGEFGVGAPRIAAKMEELISWGVQQFIVIGTAGSLQTKVAIGDFVLCERAVRDEGTSHHYIPPSRYIHAPRRMTNKLLGVLKTEGIAHHMGSSWTTDSFYRQTAEEIIHFQQEGVLTVEMEAAALFAVAHYHKVDLASMFTISGSHASLDWKPHSEEERVKTGLFELLKVALKAANDQTP